MKFGFRLTGGRILAVILALAPLGACAVPTPYQEAVDGFGYAEQEIENDRFRVTFEGNLVTPRETVETYMLYRTAEFTVQNGYDYFIIVDRETDQSTSYYTRSYLSDSYYPYAFDDRYHSRYGFEPGYISATSVAIEEFVASAEILTFKGEKPADNVNAYDAHDVLMRLQPMIVRPAP